MTLKSPETPVDGQRQGSEVLLLLPSGELLGVGRLSSTCLKQLRQEENLILKVGEKQITIDVVTAE